MKSGLLITYAFAPSALPESYVLSKSLGNIPGYRFDVVCPEGFPKWGRDDTLIPYVKDRFGTTYRAPLSKLTVMMPHKFNPLAQLPDLCVYSNSNLLKQAEALDLSRYSLLLTSSMWHSSHLVGLRLKKKYPHLKWVTRFSDPWMNNPYLKINPLCLPLNRKMESDVFSASDQIIFTSAQTRDSVLKRINPNFHAKVHSIPHCYDPVLYKSNEQNSGSDQYIIRHLGHFYGHRSPEPLFRAIEAIAIEEPSLLERVQIELVGSLGRHRGLLSAFAAAAKVIRISPPVKYLESLKLMQQAQCLLVIDAPDDLSVFLPSKLIDYLGTGRFVFAITPPGASCEVVEKAGGEIANPTVPTTIKEALKRILKNRPTRLPHTSQEFSVQEVSKLWRKVLD